MNPDWSNPLTRPKLIEASKRFVCDVARLEAQHHISLRQLSLDTHLYVDQVTKSLVVKLATHLLNNKTEESNPVTVSWPDGWWQAFKERWFRGWLLRRFPVRYRSQTIAQTVVHNRFCPHFAVPGGDRCVEFLIEP